MAAHLSMLDEALAATPGTVSVWCARLGAPPAYTRRPSVRHYAASTIKLAILVALHRAYDAGALDLDAEVPVRNSFPSALPDTAPFRLIERSGAVAARLGGTASLRWLAEQMTVVSSNLAANLVLAAVGLEAVAEVWRLAGATGSAMRRPLEDLAARSAGITNEVTAADLAALLTAIATGAAPTRGSAAPGGDSPSHTPHGGGASPSHTAQAGDSPTHAAHMGGEAIASGESCRAMLDTLFAQQHREDLAAGLPAGTRVAHKNGWVTGVRHAAGIVYPDDAPPYTLVVCTTTPLARVPHVPAPDAACRLVSRVAAASWADRHALA